MAEQKEQLIVEEGRQSPRDQPRSPVVVEADNNEPAHEAPGPQEPAEMVPDDKPKRPYRRVAGGVQRRLWRLNRLRGGRKSSRGRKSSGGPEDHGGQEDHGVRGDRGGRGGRGNRGGRGGGSNHRRGGMRARDVYYIFM